MRIYFDTCCLNRPFDDQTQNRIHLESEAIIMIMNKLYKSEWKWIGSQVLEIEIENIPHIEKRLYLSKLLNFIHELLIIQNKDVERGKQIEKIGFKPFDAMHIACAERGNVDIFLTTDDKLFKLADKSKNILNIKVSNPLKWLMEGYDEYSAIKFVPDKANRS
ncbi:PIN domain-containing protein [Candidatus Magnetomoraceae bacterium gMMP-1]